MNYRVALGLAVLGYFFLALAPTAWAVCCPYLAGWQMTVGHAESVANFQPGAASFGHPLALDGEYRPAWEMTPVQAETIANYHIGSAVSDDCNMFKCECSESKCLQPAARRYLRSSEVVETGGAWSGLDVVREADTDANGALDHVEIALYFHRQGRSLEGRDWRALEANQDGELSPQEIDSDLEPVTAS